MSQVALFPYRFAERALTLTCSIDGVETENRANGALLILDELPTQAQLNLRVSVTMVPGTLERVMPEEERTDPPARVAVVVRSVPSRFRRLLPLSHEPDDTFKASLNMSVADLHRDFVLKPVLTRARRRDAVDGYAAHSGALLADGDPIQVLLEEPPTPPGGYLDIEFEDFAASGNYLRRSNPTVLVAIDVAGEFPKLWLNSGIGNLPEIMNTRARRGAKARVREAVFQAISAQVWTSLLFTSLGALASAVEDDLDPKSALEELVEWQKRVLYFWAPRIYSTLADRDQAIEELCRAAGQGQGLAELHELATPAIQSWSGAKSAFDGLVRLITREGV